MTGVLLQMLMLAASPRRVDRRRLLEAYNRLDERTRPASFLEYSTRFNGWYLKLAHHVHNTELQT